jgi:hypothetical protein
MNLSKYSKFFYLGFLAIVLVEPLSAIAKTTVAEAADAEPQRPAVIHFANQGGIKNWNAIDSDTLQIQARNNQWFEAEMFSFCYGLTSANGIGFVTEHDGSLDKYSSVVVRGEECHFKSFEQVDLSAEDQQTESAAEVSAK